MLRHFVTANKNKLHIAVCLKVLFIRKQKQIPSLTYCVRGGGGVGFC